MHTKGFDDEGVREHVADLITERERIKKELMETKKILCANENVVDVVTNNENNNNDSNNNRDSNNNDNTANGVSNIGNTNMDGINQHEQTTTTTTTMTARAVKMLTLEDDRKYYMGEGNTVPSTE